MYEQIPIEVMNNYHEMRAKLPEKLRWSDLEESELWESLVLCILSSNVYYESAKSALDQLRYVGILENMRLNPSKAYIDIIAKELRRQIYLPRRIDGSFRRYRFPNVRAENIVSAARTIYVENEGLSSILNNFTTTHAARDLLSSSISGLGLKEASHFLRNIGYSKDLAIIDVHMISFLKEMSLISSNSQINITRDYSLLEQLLLSLTRMLKLDLSVFDMAVWRYMKKRRQDN